MKKQNEGTPKVTKSRRESRKVNAQSEQETYPELQLRQKAPAGMTLTPDDEVEINKILHGPKIKKEEYNALTLDERLRCAQIFTKGLNLLSLEDSQRFEEQISEIIEHDTRRCIWETNHFLIMAAIDSLTRKYNRFPNRYEIMKETELSRKTIHKHLKEYFASDQYKDRKDEYFAMRENILARLYLFASEGDTKAAKIFLEATAFTAEAPKIQNQNNYMQVNSLTITQEQLSQLPAPERNTFFDIIKKFTTVAEPQAAGENEQNERA